MTVPGNSKGDRLQRRSVPKERIADLQLSPKYWLSDWQRLNFQIEEDWQKAIDMVEDRIRGRFVHWIDRIIPNLYAGFATIALDCLMLETLYGFKQGKATSNTKKGYVAILTAAEFRFSDDQAAKFCENVRNGIVHDTETRSRWIIRMHPQEMIIEQDANGNYVLNRSMFHEALKKALDGWLDEMRRGNALVRERMRTRMEQIIDRHFEE